MGALPRVTELVRERIAREFDDLGPDVCMAKLRRTSGGIIRNCWIWHQNGRRVPAKRGV
jgi:hypothetical protein